MKVLIVEDEIELLASISNFLTRQNYICELAETWLKADDKLAIYQYDIVLLDITLPDGDGLGLMERIKKSQKKAGVIIISAKNSLDDKINGLDLGADDYITKPFYLSELNSRIRAVLRRKQFDGSNILIFNEISINTDSKDVKINGDSITLTKKEFDLLVFFIINKERVLTKEVIADHLWEDNIDMADTFDFIYTHLNHLRMKIKNAGGTDYIKTLYGMGYKLSNQ